MFTLNVTNNYFQDVGGHFVPIPGGDGFQVFGVSANGGKESIPNLGNFELTVPSMGFVLFRDLGNVKLPQYTNPNLPWTEHTWGGLIRYRGEDAYFRYEGGGVVNLVIDAYGSIDLSFPQGGMIVSLSDLTVS
jgi:hypothetical protein